MLFHSDFGHSEPSDENVEKMLAWAGEGFRRIFALVGGSIIDAAKLPALREARPVSDLFEGKIKPVKARELIIIPATRGAGSEVTNVSVLEIKRRRAKMGLADDALYADQAVLMPSRLADLP